MDYQAIIDKYYPEDNQLRYILMTHSTLVTKRAVRICDLHPELSLDRQFVIEAAMLHDIGIFKCNAPGIYCFGSEPYLIHGRIGAELLRAEGYPKHARVCERHTGSRHHKRGDYTPQSATASSGLPARNHGRKSHLLRRQVLFKDTSRSRKDH